jgi:hypothetical protein
MPELGPQSDQPESGQGFTTTFSGYIGQPQQWSIPTPDKDGKLRCTLCGKTFPKNQVWMKGSRASEPAPFCTFACAQVGAP